MVLFIFFNSDCDSTEQWKKNPYDGSIKSSLITKIKKYGEVYLYNPIFYNFNKFNPLITNSKYNEDYKFTLDSINLENHCKKLFEEVYKIDTQFILISHETGFIFSHVFANLYKDNVFGIININGYYTKDWLKRWLDQDKVEFIKKIKTKELVVLFENLENNKNITDTLNLLNFIVKYHIFKQYYKLYHDLNYIDCETVCFNNINPRNNLETLDKFKFCNDLTMLNNSTKIFNYLEKSNFLYFNIEKDIIETIKLMIDNIGLAELD
jgi:hypothetical protein